MAVFNTAAHALFILIAVTLLFASALAADLPLFPLEKRATPTTCSVTVKTPPPDGFVCNEEGSVRSAKPIATTTAIPLETCRDSCLDNQPQCVSFSYGPRTQCITYSDSILKSEFKRGTTKKVFSNRHCFSKKCGLCPNSLSPCRGFCYDLQTDNSHCGKCSKKCRSNTGCIEGNCVCPSGELGDDSNCGDCGTVCQHSTSCSGSQCVCPSGQLGDDNNCGNCGTVCQHSTSCSGSQCVCPSGQLGDDNNCGDCGTICQHSTSCSGSQCGCSSGDLGDDNNCGNCGTVCQHGTSCSGNQCVCSSGELGDNNNCGTCGNICTQNTGCINGACACASGQLGDNQNCGTCNNACKFGSTCSSGACKCVDGSDASNLQSNINDCGTCGNKCIGSGATCASGNCGCSDSSKTYCPQKGCISTLSFQYDSNNCGGCGTTCASGQICSKSHCITDPGSCNNRGVQWAYLANIDGENSDSHYSNFKPEHYSSGRSILHSGQIQQIGSWTENSDPVYNTGSSAGTPNYVVNHRGYIFAPLDGDYTVTIEIFVDDIVCFWLGTAAYSGYTRDNAAICRSAGVDKFSGPHQATVSLVAGNYYPFRVMFAQAQQNVYFVFSITHNSGLTVISGAPNSANPWVIQGGCNGSPPAFQPFGSES